MSKIFQVDVAICATAYIRAENAEAAAKIANEAFDFPHEDASINGRNNYFGDVPVSGLKFDDPALPDISLSPAMSFYGRCGGEAYRFGPNDLERSDDGVDDEDIDARIEELEAARDNFVIGAPDGSETPAPDQWAEEYPGDSDELDALYAKRKEVTA